MDDENAALDFDILARERTQEEQRRIKAALDGLDDDAGVRDRLIAVATAGASLWRGHDDEAYATILIRGAWRSCALRSRQFKDWLCGRYGSFGDAQSVKGISRNAVAEALDALEAHVRTSPSVTTYPAELRRVRGEGALWLDLGDETGAAVRVTAGGWQIVDAAPVPILRTPRTRALPTPSRADDAAPGGLADLLAPFVPTAEREDALLVAAWLVAALRGQGPFPLLALSGEHGSGKTSAARVLHRLTDPTGDLLAPPREDRDLIAAARGNAVLCFDNLSSVRGDLADAFCRLATGAELGGRALYTDHDLATFTAARPIVLNSIGDLAARGDLASRTVAVSLPRLTQRHTEADFWREFDRQAGAILAAALDALALGLRHLEATPTPQHRMSDFARLACAAAPAIGCSAEQMAGALEANVGDQAETLIEGDAVAMAVRDVVSERGRFRGSSGQLFATASEKVDDDVRRSRAWPANAKGFAERLRRAAPALSAVGVEVMTGKSNGTRWVDASLVVPSPEKTVPTVPLNEKDNENSNLAGTQTGTQRDARGTHRDARGTQTGTQRDARGTQRDAEGRTLRPSQPIDNKQENGQRDGGARSIPTLAPLLADADDAGVRLALDDAGGLHVEAPPEANPTLLAEIDERRAEIAALLRGGVGDGR